jgi:hypothetical protein|tara:strand:- start:859 stop:1083 length:225 start_codon:yes stop_codon:yes gene_type:complete
LEKFNLKIENISNGNITIVERASISVLKDILKNYDTKQKNNSDEPDTLVRNGKRVKISKNYYKYTDDIKAVKFN